MKENFDVVIVGGGPAGSTAAEFVAKNGASVLLLEKGRDIGVPVRCAEGVGADGLRLFFEPKPQHIQTPINAVTLISSNGTKLKFVGGEIGFILNRKVFDHYIAERAALAGAEIRTRACVTGLLHNNGSINGVSFISENKKYEVSSKVVIGADGSESRVGRWGGIHTQLKLKDFESVIQYILTDAEFKPTTCDFYFSENYSPGGYLWVFPRGEGVANVGLGVAGQYAREESAKSNLDRFIMKYYPNAKKLNTTMGCVPCAKTLKQIVAPGLLLAGDAARQVNPLSGGGIISGMIGGKLAGITAAKAVKKGDYSKEFLLQYEREWYKAEGNVHTIFYRLKETISQFTDEDLNEIAESVANLTESRKNVIKFMKMVLFKHPHLVKDAVLVFKDVIKQNLKLS